MRGIDKGELEKGFYGNIEKQSDEEVEEIQQNANSVYETKIVNVRMKIIRNYSDLE